MFVLPQMVMSFSSYESNGYLLVSTVNLQIIKARMDDLNGNDGISRLLQIALGSDSVGLF